MKFKIFLIMIICIFIVSSAWAAPISNSEILAFGTWGFNTDFFWPLDMGDPANTIDGGLIMYGEMTYWNGTNGLVFGDTNFLAYKFNTPYSISQIDFWSLPNHDPQYFMGELDIQISQNSTDGLDGVWTTIDHINGDYAPYSSPFSRIVDIQSTLWVRLWMVYEDRGGFGSTPSFYLNEIVFDGEPAPIPEPVPEPATILLIGSGLMGLIGVRKKLKK